MYILNALYLMNTYAHSTYTQGRCFIVYPKQVEILQSKILEVSEPQIYYRRYALVYFLLDT